MSLSIPDADHKMSISLSKKMMRSLKNKSPKNLENSSNKKSKKISGSIQFKIVANKSKKKKYRKENKVFGF